LSVVFVVVFAWPRRKGPHLSALSTGQLGGLFLLLLWPCRNALYFLVFLWRGSSTALHESTLSAFGSGREISWHR
jgi:hypothetical protein